MVKDRRVAAVGTFDGVHTGHKAVIGKVKEIARSRGLEPIVITFHPHPLALVNPAKLPELICSLPERMNLLKSEGVVPVNLEFNEGLRSETARQWLKRLKDEFNVDSLVVGYDNTFGSDGVSMSIEDYVSLGKEIGMEVIKAPVVKGVSSSTIRRSVKRGEIKEGNRMLGRMFTIEGNVEEGKKLGRDLGFPTANLRLEEGLLCPAPGSYAAIAVLEDGLEVPAMVNIGRRPTVESGGDIAVESHLIGWQGDLYGKHIVLKLHEYLRPEKKFVSLDALRDNLEKDKEKTLEILNRK